MKWESRGIGERRHNFRAKISLVKTNRIVGSILGLGLGDAFGAPYEGGVPERAVLAVIGTTNGKRRFTDDTQMSIDVIESLLEHGHVDQVALALVRAV